MRFEPRQYQSDCVTAWWNAFAESSTCKPIVAVPTGAGKTIIMSMLIREYIDAHPDNHVVVLSHTQDIIDQDAKALQEFFPDRQIGVYSAGLGKRVVNQITVAGIQSIYNKPQLFKWVNLWIIDECHTVNHKSAGMYRKLLDNHKGRIGGMSATVFRTGHGYVYKGSALFNKLAYDLTSIQHFNKLIEDGYLTNLIAKATDNQLDPTGVKKSAGDYNVKQLGDKLDRQHITEGACEELIKYGKNYKKWLVFAIDTDHADNICDELKSKGIHAQVLHSKMHHSRRKTVDNFKNGDTRALVSVGMVTTGFDAPNVDLIALMRPTMSPVLHVQMVGRGLRVAPKKSHCLVLDFAGNTERLGPINDVVVPKKKGKQKGVAPVKKCPKCGVLYPTATRICSVCGHVFEFNFGKGLKSTASTAEIVRKLEDNIKWLTVDSIVYQRYKKLGKPDSLLVTYRCGLQVVKEWVFLEYSGYAGRKADWWLKCRGMQQGLNVSEVLEQKHKLKEPKRIRVDFNDKYKVVVGVDLS